MGERVLITGAKSRWSLEEIQALKDLWPKAPKTEIEEAIPNRTWHSMTDKAKTSRLGIKREVLGRNPDGTFKQMRKQFSLENFDDGHIDNRGRFRVWFPEHPRAYREGYIMRSIVAYEAYHGVVVPSDMDIHHIDGNQLNDSKENLALLPHGKHSTLSNINPNLYVKRICENCNKEFHVKWFKLHDFSNGAKRRGVYCSQKCYQEHPKSEVTKKKQSISLKKAYDEERHTRRLIFK